MHYFFQGLVEGNPFVELKASPLFQDLSLETIAKGNFYCLIWLDGLCMLQSMFDFLWVDGIWCWIALRVLSLCMLLIWEFLMESCICLIDCWFMFFLDLCWVLSHLWVSGGVGSDEDAFRFTRTLKSQVVEFADLLGKTSSLCINELQRALLIGQAWTHSARQVRCVLPNYKELYSLDQLELIKRVVWPCRWSRRLN